MGVRMALILTVRNPWVWVLGYHNVTKHPWLMDTHSEISDVFIGQTA